MERKSRREQVVPVVTEDLEVRKRTRETGSVRVRSRVHKREVLVDEPLLKHTVKVERVPIGRFVDAVPETRVEGDTIVLPILEEVPVVQKRLLLKGELRITRTRETFRKPKRVVVRSTEPEIERTRAAADSPPHDHDGES